MATREKLTTRLDDQEWGYIESYQRRHGKDNTSEAVREMLKVAHREANSPLLATWKDQVINWAGILSLLAMMSVAGGVVMPSYSVQSGVSMAGMLVLMALGLVSAIELVNRANGKYDFMNAISEVKP